MTLRRLNLLFFTLAFCALEAHAADPHDIFVRTGVIAGTYTGKDLSSGSYSANINAEGELWLYRNPSEAIVARVVLANQSSLGRTRYFAAGGGQRYFLFADGMSTEQQFDGDYIRVRPHSSVYIGWDLGLGQYLVLPFGSVLSAYSTTVDVGGVVGVRKGINDRFSVDGVVGFTYSSSVLSSTSVTASTVRVLVGVGYTF
ncbi:MAG: hypothetical protein KF799_15470 [Bdellovibrionales bacterium]|nr:hypothetical protein [Bdellovibrionales bacterium]